jgi:hypothetical protein
VRCFRFFFFPLVTNASKLCFPSHSVCFLGYVSSVHVSSSDASYPHFPHKNAGFKVIADGLDDVSTDGDDI